METFKNLLGFAAAASVVAVIALSSVEPSLVEPHDSRFPSVTTTAAAQEVNSDADDIALVGLGVSVCHPELRSDPSYAPFFMRLIELSKNFSEQELHAAGQKVTAMVREKGKAAFCLAVDRAMARR